MTVLISLIGTMSQLLSGGDDMQKNKNAFLDGTREDHTDVIKGREVFSGERRLSMGDRSLIAERLIVAANTLPVRLRISWPK
ncbi:MAG: hypothetical protein ACI9R3_004381 [Verrucomicrobiales bacterium]